MKFSFNSDHSTWVLCFQWNTRLDYLKAKVRVAHASNLIEFNVRISMNKLCYLAWNVSFMINGKSTSGLIYLGSVKSFAFL